MSIETTETKTGGEEVQPKVVMNNNNDVIITPTYATSLTNNLLGLYNNGIATDFTVICEDETFNLHKAVSIHGSKYFANILTSNVTTEVTLDFEPTIQPSAFRIIVESLYTGIVKDMTRENITALLEASFHLQIKHSYDACVSFMLKHLDLDNCLSYWLCAKLCQSDKLKQASIGLIGRHLDSIKGTEEYLTLSKDTIEEILSHDSLEVPAEEKVFEAAIAWIKFDEDKRKANLSSLLNVVRLTYLPVNYLVNVVGKEELIEHDPKAMTCYSQGLKMKLRNSHGDTKGRHNPMFAARGSLERLHKQQKTSQCIPNLVQSFEETQQKVSAGIKDKQQRVSEGIPILFQNCKDQQQKVSAGIPIFVQNCKDKQQQVSERIPILVSDCKGKIDESFGAQDDADVLPEEKFPGNIQAFFSKLVPKKENDDSGSAQDNDTDVPPLEKLQGNVQAFFSNLVPKKHEAKDSASSDDLVAMDDAVKVDQENKFLLDVQSFFTKFVPKKQEDQEDSNDRDQDDNEDDDHDDYADLEDVLETSEEDASAVLSMPESRMGVNYNKENEIPKVNAVTKEFGEVTKEVDIAEQNDIVTDSHISTLSFVSH